MGKLFSAESDGTCGMSGTDLARRRSIRVMRASRHGSSVGRFRPTILFKSVAFMVSLSGVFLTPLFLAAKPRRSWGTWARGRLVADLEVLFQVGRGNKLKLELRTPC